MGLIYRIIRFLLRSKSCKILGHSRYGQSHGFGTENHYGYKICYYCGDTKKTFK